MLTLTTPPSALLTIEQLRDHCRVDGTDSDSALLAYLAAAVAYVDGPYGAVGKAIGAQEWTLSRGRVTGTDRVEIPVLPFVSVVSGSYYDAANASQTLTLADFRTYGGEDVAYIEPLVGNTWPAMYDRPDALSLVISAGYAEPPENVLHALRLLVSHWYENREAVDGASLKELPLAVFSLLGISRVGWIKA
tara:strand:+ start:1224 stop:1796 length:573 start_codon:yes stop_codon:yes gene_type:complete